MQILGKQFLVNKMTTVGQEKNKTKKKNKQLLIIKLRFQNQGSFMNFKIFSEEFSNKINLYKCFFISKHYKNCIHSSLHAVCSK